MNAGPYIDNNNNDNIKSLWFQFHTKLKAFIISKVRDEEAAEDILQDSFLKIFFRIKDFTGSGSFEGWMRKIVVNTAITNYHANLKYRYHVDIEDYVSVETGVTGFDEDFFTADELIKVLNELPRGYRMVFNLYAVEGYKHKEIAEMMGIDTNTSKSQYSRAKAVIRDRLEQLGKLRTKYPL